MGVCLFSTLIFPPVAYLSFPLLLSSIRVRLAQTENHQRDIHEDRGDDEADGHLTGLDTHVGPVRGLLVGVILL